MLEKPSVQHSTLSILLTTTTVTPAVCPIVAILVHEIEVEPTSALCKESLAFSRSLEGKESRRYIAKEHVSRPSFPTREISMELGEGREVVSQFASHEGAEDRSQLILSLMQKPVV